MRSLSGEYRRCTHGIDQAMLIIGGSGFIGRHLCAWLSEKGRKAVCVSRTVPDENFLVHHAPLTEVMTRGTFDCDLETHLSRHSVVVYLASDSIPGTFKAEPWRELSVNVEPLMRVAQAAVNAKYPPKLIYVSSGGTVYGRGKGTAFVETDPLEPISSYGYGKVAAEEALRFLRRTSGLRYAILRAANPIGRWQSSNVQGIVSAAIRAAQTGSSLTLFGGGLQVRDFFDADDLAAAIAAAGVDSREAGVWNVGSGVGTCVIDVIRLVEEATGRPIEISMLPGREIDVPYAVLDCGRAEADLGWMATFELRESIARIVAAR